MSLASSTKSCSFWDHSCNRVLERPYLWPGPWWQYSAKPQRAQYPDRVRHPGHWPDGSVSTFPYLPDIWFKSFKSKRCQWPCWTWIQSWRPTWVLSKLQARQATIWGDAQGSCVYGVYDFADLRLFLGSWEKPMDGRWIWLILKSPTGAVEFGWSTTSSVFPDISISLCPFLWGNLRCDPLEYQGMLSCEHHALIWPGLKLIEKDHRHPSITLWYVYQYLPCIYQPLCPPHCMFFLWRMLIQATSWH